MMLLDSRGGLPPDLWERWDEVKKGEVMMMGSGRGHEEGRAQGGKGVEVDLQWGQIGKLRKTRQELGFLGGCRPHIPRDQMCGATEEVGHRGALLAKAWCSVPTLGPVLLFALFFKFGPYIRLTGQLLFSLVYWRVDGPKHFVGCPRQDDLPDHPAS